MYNESITELNQRVKNLKKERDKKQKEVEAMDFDIHLIEGLITLKKERKSFHNYIRGIYNEEIPATYEKGMFQEKKIIYAINKLGQANVKLISEFIMSKESDADYDSIYKRVQQVVIKLTKEYKVIKIGDYASEYKLNILDEKHSKK